MLWHLVEIHWEYSEVFEETFFQKKIANGFPACSSVTHPCDWEFSQSDQRNKISQQIFDYNESDHLQCMIEIFKNSETNSKKTQNKI